VKPPFLLSGRWLAVCCGGLLAGAVASAAPADDVPWVVQPGDTLYALAARHLERAADWPVLARHNRLSTPSRLKPGQTLRLPAALLRGTPQQAELVYLRGDVVASMAGRERHLAVGDRVQEGERLQVNGDGFASLRLADGSALQLPAGSRTRVERLREVAAAARSRTVIGVERGRIELHAVPQRPGSRFDVRTPLAVAGVRGTRFGVALAADGRRMLTDVLEGRVEVTASALPVAVAVGQGAVVELRSAQPQIRALLPAPDLAAWPQRVERVPTVIAWTGAAAYRVAVADDEAFTRVWLATDTTGPRFELPALPDGVYRARVRTLARDGLPGGEAELGFRIKTLPVAPLAREPQAAQRLAAGLVTLRCTEVEGATGYRLQLSRSARFDAPTVLQAEGACRFEVDAGVPGDYHWRVATLAAVAPGDTLPEAERGPYSDASRFTAVRLPPPPEPIVEADAGGLRLHWAAEPGTRFEVQVARDATFADRVEQRVIERPELRLQLPPSCTPYRLRLVAIDAQGLRGLPSPARLLDGGAGVCSAHGLPLTDGSGQAVQAGAR
jgi:hypothetical protein